MKKIITTFVFALLVSFQSHSQDTITTLRPSITLDTFAVCVGSVIDVPFYSTGQFTAGNVYTAQLSDSAGDFNTYSIIGTFATTNTFDSTLGSLPGSVSGNIADVPDGCNYYIRVISSHPSTTGAVYGPFCIQHCDILPNNGENIHLCLTPNTVGIDTPIYIQIHTWDSVQTYNPGNQFKVELLDTINFSPVGALGALGSVTASHDTTLMLTIPPLVTLQAMGISPGSYYMRIVATEDIYPDSSLSSLIRFTLGAPADNPPATLLYDYSTFALLTSDTICNTETIFFEPNPFNSISEYVWTSAQLNGSPLNQQTMAVLLTGFTGDFIWTLQEINYGCPGPVSAPDTLIVKGPPNVTIIGPHYVCLGDTNYFYVPFESDTYYSFTSQHGLIIDSLNDTVIIRFDTLGTYVISVLAVNTCGASTNVISVVVEMPPTAYIYDSIVLNNTVYFFDTVTITGNSYYWQFGDNSGNSSKNPVHVYPGPGTYNVSLTVTNQCGTETYYLIVVITPYGIPNISSDSYVNISPNPNIGNFTLKYSQLSILNSQFIIKDVLGRTVYTHNINGAEGKETIDVSDLSNGVYFYQLSNLKETIRGKFVKE